MLLRLAQRVTALACIAAIAAILASNLWCESACVADQRDVTAAGTTTCHEAQTVSLAIGSHHDCRDHQLESLTATATQRVDLWQGTPTPTATLATDLRGLDAVRAARTSACPSPPARSVAVLRI